MKIQIQKKNGGYVLMIVLVLGTIGLMFMAGAMNWSDNTAKMTARNNEYFTSSYAAEAATSRSMAALLNDYKIAGDSTVISHLDQYRVNVPTSTNGSYWTNYTFSDGSGNANRMSVSLVTNQNQVWLASPYAGLISVGSTYQIVADAKNNNSLYNITAGVGQEVNTGTIPLFQFAIFYDHDLEIKPGADMVVSGLVHCNHDMYISPGANLTFSNDVSATGNIYMNKKAGDQQGNGTGTTTFMGQHLTNVNALNLPVGTNLPTGIHGIIEVPPTAELPTSAAGTNRLYNQVDMVVLVSNTSVTVKSGYGVDNFSTTIPQAQWSSFINTNGSFYNVREAATVRPITLDVGKLRTWSALSTNILRSKYARGASDIQSVFIADMRTMNSTQEAGVCLTNGAYLPSTGLTVVTPDPAYTIGDYNTSVDGVSFHASTADTTYTKPASIMCDAFFVLSTTWNPSKNTATNTLSDRPAGNTTVNSAFITGNVETTNISSSFGYSGGVENFPRFLEDWNPSSGQKTMTYNGSMVELFNSTIANNPWMNTGTSYQSYNPPVRHWNFDENYLIPGKAPPLTPCVKTISAPRWVLMAPNTSSF